jgi:folylpolyglutamate synthase/dihydropteroate synthase
MQICTNLNKQHLEWVYPRTINEICRQKVGYMSNNTNIYIGKQKPKVLGIVKKILKKNNSSITYPTTWKIINKNKKIFYKDNKNLIKINSKYIYSKGLVDNLGLAIKIALDLNIKKK